MSTWLSAARATVLLPVMSLPRISMLLSWPAPVAVMLTFRPVTLLPLAVSLRPLVVLLLWLVPMLSATLTPAV